MAVAYARGVRIGDRYRLDAPVRDSVARSDWTATDERSEKRVTIEIVELRAGEDAATRRRRLRESRGACAVRHQAIVRVEELLEIDPDTVAFAMDFHPGESLQDRLERLPGPMPAAEACAILLPVAAALETAASVGIAHGDLAPDRVVLVSGQDAKVKGFGVAALLARSGVSSTGDRLFYSAPEGPGSGAGIDGRADMWSLGMTLYRCLTGAFPLHAETAADLARALRDEPATPIEPEAPGLPADVAALVKKMLSIDPAARPAHMGEVRGVLASHARAAAAFALEGPRGARAPVDLGGSALSDPEAAKEAIVPAAAGLAEARERVQSRSSGPPQEESAAPSGRPGRRLPAAQKVIIPAVIRDDEMGVTLGPRVGGALLVVHGLAWFLTGSAGFQTEVRAPPVLMAVIGLVLLAGKRSMVDAARVIAVIAAVILVLAEGALVDGDFAVLQAIGYVGAGVCLFSRPMGVGGLLGGLMTTMVCIGVFSAGRSLRAGGIAWLRQAQLLRGDILPDAADAISGNGYRMTLPRGAWYPASTARAQKTHEWVRSMVVRPERAAYIAVLELPPEARLSSFNRMKLLVLSRSSFLGRNAGRARFVTEWAFTLDQQECRGTHVETVERGIDIACDILATGVAQTHGSLGKPLLVIVACAPRTAFPAVSEEMTLILKSLSL